MEYQKGNSGLGALIIVGIIIYIIFNNEKWIGFYYPNKYDLTKHKQSEILNTYDECIIWVNSNVGNNSNYDYECGRNCEYKENYGLYICEETIK